MYVLVANVFIQKILIHCFQTFLIKSVFQNYSNQYRMIVFFSYFGFDVFARSCKDHLTRKQQIRLRLGLRGRVLASVGLIPKTCEDPLQCGCRTSARKNWCRPLLKWGEWRPCRPSPICSLPAQICTFLILFIDGDCICSIHSVLLFVSISLIFK